MGTHLKRPHPAGDAHVAYEMGSVDLHLLQRELVDHDLAAQQRPQLHVGHHTAHVGHGVVDAGQRVVGLEHLHVFQRKVKGKSQTHIAHTDSHARFFRSDA